MDTPISMPFMERRLDNLHIQKGPMPNGATAFLQRAFVKLVAGVLVPCATADVVCYGQSPDKSHAATDRPPEALYANLHWVFNPADAEFIVNITDNAGHVGQAAGAPQLSAIAVGTEYGIYVDGNGYMYLNSQDVTNKFFHVLSIYPNQSLTDYNGKVLVKLVPTIIQ